MDRENEEAEEGSIQLLDSYWWKPKEQFDVYKFGFDVNEIQDFYKHHFVQKSLSVVDSESTQYSFKEPYKGISLGVESNIIVSATCYQDFVIKTNVIGRHIVFALNEVIQRFGVRAAQFTCDDQVVYDEEDIQMDVDFEELGLILTINLQGIVLSVTVIGS